MSDINKFSFEIITEPDGTIRLANPGCLSWIRGYSETQVRLMGKRRKRK